MSVLPPSRTPSALQHGGGRWGRDIPLRTPLVRSDRKFLFKLPWSVTDLLFSGDGFGFTQGGKMVTSSALHPPKLRFLVLLNRTPSPGICPAYPNKSPVHSCWARRT